MNDKEFLDGLEESIQDNRVYDFIASDYWLMNKEQLKELILNIIWENKNINWEKVFCDILERMA